MKGERQSPTAGDIRFEHVSFAYQDKEVLHDVTVTLPNNSLTALVGPSGSGKSTLMKLCARFYDPQKGHIYFNGVPMNEINPESLMSHISMVFQDVYLFQDTIRNNIRFGKTDARSFMGNTGKHFWLETMNPFRFRLSPPGTPVIGAE